MRFTKRDYVQLAVWYVPLFVSIHYLGFLKGFLIYSLTIAVIKRFMKAFYKLEMLAGADELFFLDSE